MSIRFERYRPHPRLAPYVRFYYAVRTAAGAASTAPIENHPQGGVDLVFGFSGATAFVGGSGEARRFCGFGLSLLGVQDGPVAVRLGAGLERFCIAFEPEGFARLVDLAPAFAMNRSTSVRDDAAPEWRELHERLGGTSDDRARVDRLDAFLLERLRRSLDRRQSFARLEPLLAEVRRTGGRRSLDDLAAAAGVSPRTVQRWTRDLLGTGAKTYSRIVRFNAALKLHEERPHLDWYDVLVRTGYYDQSHFIAEFRRFAGTTPLRFAKGDSRLSRMFTGGEVDALELGE